MTWLTTKRAYALSLVILCIDQISKYSMLRAFDALVNCPPPPKPWLNPAACDIAVFPFLHLTMVWNQGVSLGLLQAYSGWGRWLLVGLTAVIAGVVAVLLRREHDIWQRFAFALILGGAIGNIIDRARFGAVVDFVNVLGIPYWKYVFNVADSAISIGVVLIFIRALTSGSTSAQGEKK
jgi:signal peptidase II